MYVIYWQNFSVNPSVIFDSKLQGPNPGLGCIHIKWLWIIYFRNDRLGKCALHMRNEIPQHIKFPVSLRSSFFHLAPILTFPPFHLKVLKRSENRPGKRPSHPLPGPGCSKTAVLEERKEIIPITTDSWHHPWEVSRVMRRMMARVLQAHLG